MEEKERVSRITEMEARMDRVLAAAGELERARESWEAVKPPLELLITSYKSYFRPEELEEDEREALTPERREELLSPEEFWSLLERVTALQKARERWEEIRPDRESLAAYYEGPLWREDFEADERGELPPELKRGVLSEDGLWNLLEQARELDEEPPEAPLE